MSPDPAVPGLAEYLEGVRDYIDLSIDSAEPLGGWEVIPGAARFTVRANWKLMVENSIDKYHFPTVHLTYSQYQAKRRQELGRSTPASERWLSGNDTLGFGTKNGHGGFIQFMPGRPIATESSLWSEEANQEVRRLHDLLIGRFGEERGREMTEHARHLLIYPNTIFQDSATGFRIRVIDPIDAESMQVSQWEFRPRREIPELTQSRMESSRAFLGPGGFGTPDDVEALESCQVGFRATAELNSDVSRGMYRAPSEPMAGDDEEQQRAFWRRWNEQVGGREVPT
jgi:p-cumate 2,3-dioxygenase alpha subunit